jgi:glycosyltransferase involved in cell wall biosynthesis
MNDKLKICLIIPYFERPNMFMNAINSFLNITYDNWEIRIIDDGSIKAPVKDLFKNIPEQIFKKIFFYNTNDTLENKSVRGSIHGQYMNMAIKDSVADIFVMMSDDDAVHEQYFENLNNFYSKNLHIKYSYSHVIPFDPFSEKPSKELLEKQNNKIWFTNSNTVFLNHVSPLNPYCRVDSTQVSWRSECNKVNNIWLPDTQTKNLDASFYSQMFSAFGLCVFNGFISVYKGIHRNQLGVRSGIDQFMPLDLPNAAAF